jgi:hypothetical protein
LKQKHLNKKVAGLKILIDPQISKAKTASKSQELKPHLKV